MMAANGDAPLNTPFRPKIRPVVVASVPLPVTSNTAARIICCKEKLNRPSPARANANRMPSPVLTTNMARTDAVTRPGISTCFRPYLSDRKPSTGAAIIPVPLRRAKWKPVVKGEESLP